MALNYHCHKLNVRMNDSDIYDTETTHVAHMLYQALPTININGRLDYPNIELCNNICYVRPTVDFILTLLAATQLPFLRTFVSSCLSLKLL